MAWYGTSRVGPGVVSPASGRAWAVPVSQAEQSDPMMIGSASEPYPLINRRTKTRWYMGIGWSLHPYFYSSYLGIWRGGVLRRNLF
eukprot:751727-Hanusia_phi.AAC.2